jgi:hypothetical protein
MRHNEISSRTLRHVQRRVLLCLLTATALLWAILDPSAASPAHGATVSVVSGAPAATSSAHGSTSSVRTATARTTTSGAASSAGAPQSLIVQLAQPHQAALTRYLAEVDTAGSPNFHHFLTPAQFVSRFGATGADVKRVLATLKSLGMTDTSVAANHLYVSIKRVPARSAHITSTLSSALGDLITGVVTPAEMPTPAPDLTRPSAADAGAAGASASELRSARRAGIDGGSSPCLAAGLSGGYTSPQLASAYNFNGLYAQGFHGEGMSAAVIEYGGYHDGNVNGFKSCYGISTPVSRVRVDGGASAVANSSETEVALDVEVILEMAPKLQHLYVYEAPNTGTGEIGDYDAFVSQDLAPVLSVSWGECEEGSSQGYERLLGAITEEAAAQGQQIFVAAGDDGSKGCSGDALPTGHSLSADSEASLPWVTGVGGTDLSEASTEAGATVHREDVWDDGLGAGGGGESVAWTMPSWQRSYLTATGDHPDGLANDCDAPSGVDCRMEPDISMNADAEEGGADPTYWDVPAGPTPAQFSYQGDRGSPGYSIYCASADCYVGGSGWQRVGGTSAATPLAAAAAVLWDQQAQSAGVSLGWLNPEFYAVASNPTSYAKDFYDVTGGDNNDLDTTLACDVGCSSRLYDAGKGYDMATGLGAVNVGNLGSDLIADAGAVSVTPADVQMYGNTGGGPSTTANVSVTAPAVTGADHSYTATSSAGWLVVSPSASAPDSLQWHVDPTGLAAGRYTGQVTITDADGSTATLTVRYEVTAPAKLALASPSLHFVEHQVKPFGEKTLAICGSPLWGDELEARGLLYPQYGVSLAGDEARGTRRTLAFTNLGGPGSVLHYSIDETHTSWISNDLDPTGNPRDLQLKPEQPLVPSQGAVSRGHTARVKLASLANANTVGSYPALQQGTYHGTVLIHNLADPADSATVPVTLTLGSGRGTPRLATSVRALSVHVSAGQHKTVSLGLEDPGAVCGYGYTAGTSAPWLSIDPAGSSGTVGPAGKRITVTFAPPAGSASATYHAMITLGSLNSAVSELRVPVTLTVSPAGR